jgi:hypothetical protein
MAFSVFEGEIEAVVQCDADSFAMFSFLGGTYLELHQHRRNCEWRHD